MAVSTMLLLQRVHEENKQIIILLIARSTSYTLNLTVSRAFLLNASYFILIAFLIIKVVSGAIYTYAIVVQSTTVTQSKFVPLNATTIILVNAITGVIIWQDWRVVSVVYPQCYSNHSMLLMSDNCFTHTLNTGSILDRIYMCVPSACSRLRSFAIGKPTHK